MTPGTLDAMSKGDTHLNVNLEDVVCPICMDIPHNAVLLNCSSYDGGCRTFICDTDDSHSNCLDRYKRAHGLPSTTKVYSTATGTSSDSSQSFQVIPSSSDSSLTCPMCRGNVTGFVFIDKVCAYLNMKERCCGEKQCAYVGNYMELHQHVKQEHPDSYPSEVDPERQRDWDDFQQSSEITDVLSTIRSEVPHGVVYGNYVIDYGDESGDEFEDFPGDDGNWWTSSSLHHVFDNFRSSRERQQLRNEETRRVHRRAGYVGHMDDGFTSYTGMSEYHFEGSATDGRAASSRNHSQHRTNTKTEEGNNRDHCCLQIRHSVCRQGIGCRVCGLADIMCRKGDIRTAPLHWPQTKRRCPQCPKAGFFFSSFFLLTNALLSHLSSLSRLRN